MQKRRKNEDIFERLLDACGVIYAYKIMDEEIFYKCMHVTEG